MLISEEGHIKLADFGLSKVGFFLSKKTKNLIFFFFFIFYFLFLIIFIFTEHSQINNLDVSGLLKVDKLKDSFDLEELNSNDKSMNQSKRASVVGTPYYLVKKKK